MRLHKMAYIHWLKISLVGVDPVQEKQMTRFLESERENVSLSKMPFPAIFKNLTDLCKTDYYGETGLGPTPDMSWNEK